MPGEGNSNPVQYSCLENFMDRGVWWATVHGTANNQAWLSSQTHRGSYYTSKIKILKLYIISPLKTNLLSSVQFSSVAQSCSTLCDPVNPLVRPITIIPAASAAAAVTSVVSDSVQWQPTRLPCPWDSPGKDTGVGCHFLLQCMKVKVKVKSLSRVGLLATPWTAAYQAPSSMGFSRQEYWSGVPLPSPNYNPCCC